MSSVSSTLPAHRRIRRGFAAALAAAFVTVGLVIPAQSAMAAPAPAYDSIPTVLPASYPSEGFQATSTAEFGDQVTLGGTQRVLDEVTVVFVSWTCENWASGDPCATPTPNSSYSHPISLNVYAPGVGATPGALLATVQQNVNVPFRPSPSTNPADGCSGTQWFSATLGTCQNGYAFPVTFDLGTLNVTLPDTIVVTVAFNTQTYGAAPIGANTPANSLNVAVSTTGGPTVGTDVSSDVIYVNSSNAVGYGDGGVGGLGSLRADTGWDDYDGLVMEITTEVQLPTEAEDDDPVTAPAAGGPTLAATGVVAGGEWIATGAAAAVLLGILAAAFGYRVRRLARHSAR